MVSPDTAAAAADAAGDGAARAGADAEPDVGAIAKEALERSAVDDPGTRGGCSKWLVRSSKLSGGVTKACPHARTHAHAPQYHAHSTHSTAPRQGRQTERNAHTLKTCPTSPSPAQPAVDL